MRIDLSKPDLERFIAEQVKRGHFRSPSDVVEAALALFRDEVDMDFDDESLNAIRTAAAQLDRGEGRPLDEVSEKLRKKYAS